MAKSKPKKQTSASKSSKEAPAPKRTKTSRDRKKRQTPLPWVVGGVVLVALIALPIVINARRSAALPGEAFASQGNTHIQLGSDHPAYNSDPPTSGWHTPDLARWGSYDFVVPDERVLHNLEDGGVALWYTLGTPEENQANIQALEEVARGYERVIIAPRENMPTRYALTAWQRVQRFDEIDEEGMREFLEAFEGIDHHRG